MKRLLVGVAIALGASALQTGGASGSIAASSGDHCAVSGNGNEFVLSITIPAGAPRQGGFAIGAPGTKVSLIVIQSISGSDSSATLPSGTTLEQIDQNPLFTGDINVSVETESDFSGTFVVVPVRFPPTSYFGPVTCSVPASMDQSNVFHPGTTFAWSATAGGWEESVEVPGPGVLAFHSSESKALIRSNGIVVQHAGSATLIIKPTPAGTAALAAHGSITVPLVVIFTPNRGEVAAKTMTATLRRGA